MHSIGNTCPMAGERMIRALTNIAKIHKEGNILVVTHAGVIINAAKIIAYDTTMKFKREGNKIQNCSVTIMNYEEEQLHLQCLSDISFRLKNDTKHLF